VGKERLSGHTSVTVTRVPGFVSATRDKLSNEEINLNLGRTFVQKDYCKVEETVALREMTTAVETS
jgi:hypothetical protein